MKIVVLGATGGTGIELVKRAIERGHSVTAFVRSSERLAPFVPRIRVVEGDVLSSSELAGAIAGHDAVLSALGPRNPKSPQRLVGPFARSLTKAMAESGVSRLVILSVAFLFRDAIMPPTYAAGKLFFGHYVEDCDDMEQSVRASRLDWTIVRPPRLTDKPPSGKYRVLVGHLPFMGFTAARSDVARFMVKAAEEHSYIRDIVGLAD